MDQKKLSPKQEKFCQLYHKTGNARKSYIDAGYKVKNENSADAYAAQILSNTKVQQYLAHLKKEAMERHNLSVDELLRANVAIAFAKLSNVIKINSEGEIELLVDGDLDELDGISFSKQTSFSSSDKGDSESKTVSISVKRPDRIKALQEIARLTGAYEKGSKQANPDGDGDNKENAARAILDAFARLGKKQLT